MTKSFYGVHCSKVGVQNNPTWGAKLRSGVQNNPTWGAKLRSGVQFYQNNSSLPNSRNPNQILQIGDGFGFLLFFSYDFFPNGVAVWK